MEEPCKDFGVVYDDYAMMPARDSFEDWKNRIGHDPQEATRYFLHKVASIPKNDKGAIFSNLPGEEILASSFQKAAEYLHKPLGGVPYLLKDLFDVAGEDTHCGSSFLAEARGKPKKSSAIYRTMEKQGGVYCGKTQMNEFAYGLSGQNDHFGNCPHPVFTDRLSGGSSSGSAWAVGSGLVPLAFGTDTGGSIRAPAAFCGIFGIRLIPGLPWISEGAFPLASTFDTPGWFTGSARDMIVSLQAMIGANSEGKLGQGLYFDGYNDTVEPALLERYNNLIGKLDVINKPTHTKILNQVFEGSADHYKVIVSIEAWKTHKNWLDDYQDSYSPRVWERIDGGRHRTMDDLLAARDFSDFLSDAIYELLIEFDYVVMPATPFPALEKNTMSESIRSTLLRLTAPGSFAGLPILTVPVFLDNGLSGGLQFIYRKDATHVPVKLLEAFEAF